MLYVLYESNDRGYESLRRRNDVVMVYSKKELEIIKNEKLDAGIKILRDTITSFETRETNEIKTT